MRKRRKKFIVVGISVLFLGAIGLGAFLLWWYSPEQAVPRLLQEMKYSGRSLNINRYFRTGRQIEEIEEDFRRLGPRAVPPLISALNGPDGSIRWLAAAVLGHIGDARAIQPLILATKDPDDVVAGAAVSALGEIGDRSAVGCLVASLKDTRVPVRYLAAQALGRIGDKGAVDPLIEVLHDGDISPRAYAAEALGKLGDARVIGPLIGALRDSDSWVRREAALSLGKLGRHEAVPELIAALPDNGAPNCFMRLEVVRLLGELGDRRAKTPLEEVVRTDRYEEMKDAARLALKRINDSGN